MAWSRRERSSEAGVRIARYLEDVEGFDRESFEIVHYGIEPNGEPKPYTGAVPRLRTTAACRCGIAAEPFWARQR